MELMYNCFCFCFFLFCSILIFSLTFSFISYFYKKMNQQMEKIKYCFPERVYHCPCLRMFVIDCFNHGEYSVADIDNYLKYYNHKNNLSCKKIFSKIVGEDMEHYLIICETHLKTLLVTAEKKCVHQLKIIKLFLSSTQMKRFVLIA